MEKEKLNQILNEHKLWLNCNKGRRANLSGADLSRADLSGADLSRANLSGADLSRANLREVNLFKVNLFKADLYGADLSRANLREANLFKVNLFKADLSGADLRGADLREANLRGANLYEANLRETHLSGADLSRADLSGADLSRADLREAILYGADLRGALGAVINCPETGSFVAYKKAYHDCRDVIVKLMVAEDAKRSSATSRKCRCDKATVLEISDVAGIKTDFKEAHSGHDVSFIYRVGETVSVDNFDENRWEECAAGIHFFITRQEAVDF